MSTPYVRPAFALAAAAVFLVCSTFLVGSALDEEEFRFAILSAWLQMDAVFDGRAAFWTSRLGLGVPLPFVPSFVLHPLAPLLAVVSPATWSRALLFVHTLLGAAGVWRLTRHLGITPFTSAICLATYLLAAPVQNYIFTDFWPTHYITWTTAPWLLLFAWWMLDATDARTRVWSVAMGLCAGLVLVSTNPAHVAVYGVVALSVAVTHARSVLQRARWMALAAVIAAAIASPILVQLAHEWPWFDRTLRLTTLPAPLPTSALWRALLSPIIPIDPNVPLSRLLFFGGPFLALALLGCVQFRRQRPDLVLTMAVSTFLLFSALVPLPFISARYQLRDPLTLAAIPLAGLALDRLIAERRTVAVRLAIAGQLLAVLIAAWPSLSRTWISDARRAEWIGGGSGIGEVADVIAVLVPPGARMAFAPAADEAIFDGRHIIDGLGVNALAYRDVTVVNGWFKAVSAGSLSPDERLLYGRVAVPPQMMQSPAGLDVLGVRYVLANPDERVAGDLRRLRDITKYGGAFTLYENGDAWPIAFLLDPDVENLTLAPMPGCEHRRMLCLDFEPVAARRLSAGVSVTHRDGLVLVRLLPADEPRLLAVTQMFRPDWRASSPAGPLHIEAIAGGMIGVRVPPGVTQIELDYRPTAVIAAHALALATMIASAGVLIARARATTPSARSASDSRPWIRRRG